MKTLKVTSYNTPRAVIAPKGAALRILPMDGAATASAALDKDIPLLLSKTINGYAEITVNGDTLYIAYDALLQTPEFKDVRAYEVYAEEAVPILSFPGELGEKIGQVEANSLVRVSHQNGDYASIRHGDVRGYIALGGLRKMSALFDKGQPVQNYYLFLNKATRELTVYLADADGKSTGEIVRSVIIAIGKRTTPTPAGVFQLGARERWHYFGPSYVPFAIKYAPGRYLHGPLYYSASEGAVNRAHLSDFGKMATGGCLRIPYDDMLWIYCHCMESNATLEIVNGI